MNLTRFYVVNERHKSAEVAKSGLRRRARDPLVLSVPQGFKSPPRRIFNFYIDDITREGFEPEVLEFRVG